MNLPNKLTVLRVVMIPFCIYFLLDIRWKHSILVALILFCVASFTDFLDGYLARRDGLVTDFGKLMDPLADKLLVTSVLIGFIDLSLINAYPNPVDGVVIHIQLVTVVVVMLIIAREFIVTSLRLIASNKGAVIAADKLGKLKTVLQMVFIINAMAMLYVDRLNLLGSQLMVWVNIHQLLMGFMTIITVVSGLNYVYKNRGLFLDDR